MGKKIARLMRKPEEIEMEVTNEDGSVAKDKLLITPLKVKNVDLINKLGNTDPEVSLAATKEIIKMKLIENGYDEPTDAELSEMDWEYADKILTSVMNLNNIDISEQKIKLLADIREKQQKAGIKTL